jgi:hypothetical protein
MEINKVDAAGITTDSVVSAREDGSCGGSVMPFLDINVIGDGPPIAYQTALKGEVTYFAEIGYLLPPRPWWQGAVLIMIGDGIYIELVGGVAIIIGGAVLIIFVCRRARENRRA